MGLTSLVELHLEQNLISQLPENTWIRNRNLEKLFLFSNNLEELNERTFNGLVSLISLFLNNNILKDINSRVFIHTPSLQKLYDGFVSGFKYCLYIFFCSQIDSNKFQYLPPKIFDPLTQLQSVKLGKNPWHCDCNILYLSMYDNYKKLDENKLDWFTDGLITTKTSCWIQICHVGGLEI